MNIVTKDPNLHHEVLDMAKSLYTFMKTKFEFTCEPSIHFLSDVDNAKKILGRTGFYNPSEESVHVYITNRHPKDILRSLAHELLHHIQGCEGMVDSKRGDTEGTKDPNYVLHDKFLRKIEADAFERGNICFREWEAHVKQGDVKVSQEKLKEVKIPKKKLSRFKQKVKKHADKLKKSNPSIPDPVKFATAANMAKKDLKIYGEKAAEENWSEEMSLEEDKKQEKEVVINDALKNSLYYVKEDRAMPVAYEMRDEKIYNDLLRKFKIKK